MRRKNPFNENSKRRQKKERIIMIASSAFVLAALTLTGVYVRSSSEKQKDNGYKIDFSSLEQEIDHNPLPQKEEEIQAELDRNIGFNEDDDLDYSPMEPAGSGDIQLPFFEKSQNNEIVLPNPLDIPEEPALQPEKEEKPDKPAENKSPIQDNIPDFKAGDTLCFAITGTVLIPYSMDKTVYFATLDQYKYSRAVVLEAKEGDSVLNVAAGKVKDIFFDAEIGSAVSVDIGNGYVVTYGQLSDIAVSEGDYVGRGELIGKITTPTKYYSAEGTNAYFALTKDDVPQNPMGQLQ